MLRNKKCQEYLLAGIGFLLFVLLILLITGTLLSGLHLVDDHEFFSIANTIEEDGFGRGLCRIVKDDFSLRFRPLYTVVRVVGVCLLGHNATLWSVCKAIEISLAMLLFYIFAREVNTSKLFSAFFAILIMLGEQSAIWWRLGPQESLGVLLFSAGMVTTLLLGRKRTKTTIIGFVLILALLSWQKEAFCLTVPGFFLLLMAYDAQNAVETEKNNLIRFLCTFMKVHMVEIILIGFIIIIDIYAIVCRVGTDRLGYAGFSQEWPITDYILGIWDSITKSCFPYILLAIIMMIFMQIEFKKEKRSFKEIFEVLFCIYLVGIEYVVYAKSGMEERYLIPWVIGIFYFVIIIGYRIICDNKRVIRGAVELLMLFTIYFTMLMLPKAISFAGQGQDLEKCMEYIGQIGSQDMEIATVTRIREEDGSFAIILKGLYGYDCKQMFEYDEDIVTLKNADVLFGKSGQVYYRLEQEAALSLEDYVFFETDNYEVGVKKEKME